MRLRVLQAGQRELVDDALLPGELQQLVADDRDALAKVRRAVRRLLLVVVRLAAAGLHVHRADLRSAVEAVALVERAGVVKDEALREGVRVVREGRHDLIRADIGGAHAIVERRYLRAELSVDCIRGGNCDENCGNQHYEAVAGIQRRDG